VGVATEVIEPGTSFQVPVYRHRPRQVEGIIKEIYSVEMCGFRVEAGNINQVARLAEQLLVALINVARLPTYVFIARHSRGIYPVYTIGDEVFATTPGGPVFRHVELANVRRYLGQYLHDVGELGGAGGPDTLHVRGVHGQTLGLIRPMFYLKKRIPGENEFWAPVFEGDDGRFIYTYAASAHRQVEIAGGSEVLALRQVVAEALMAGKRLRKSYDLRPDRLMPAYWERLEATLRPLSRQLRVAGPAGPVEMPLYRHHDAVLAVELRRAENRPGLFIGRDAIELRDRVVQDYVRRGLVESGAAVRIVSTAVPEKVPSPLDALVRDRKFAPDLAGALG
jgi:hypothetical protein